jgi:hypothetical protein
MYYYQHKRVFEVHSCMLPYLFASANFFFSKPSRPHYSPLYHREIVFHTNSAMLEIQLCQEEGNFL